MATQRLEGSEWVPSKCRACVYCQRRWKGDGRECVRVMVPARLENLDTRLDWCPLSEAEGGEQS